jgi:putative tricarboxylic transport membrane protein
VRRLRFGAAAVFGAVSGAFPMGLPANRIFAIIIAIGALLYLYFAFQIPSFPIRRPVDSDLFPKVLGGLMLLLSIFLFFERPTQSAIGEEPENEPTTGRWGWILVIITALTVAAYAWALPRLGFLASSVAMTVGLSWLYGYRRHIIVITVGVAIPLIMYLVLTRLMGIFLPRGIIPF